jgi:MoaA/NifB/PqqE/SkfB family radical SAM enzyme
MDVSLSNSLDLSPPKIISMTMTSRCNLRCVMCDHGIRNVEKQDFKADLVDMAGDFIASAALVDLTGLGEPMLSDLFWTILKKFPLSPAPADGEFFLTFNSNGTLLNERNIDRVLASRVRKIRISLDSADPDLFRHIRGTALPPIVDGIRALVAKRNASGMQFPKIGIEMTLMRANLDGVCDMIDLCADMGVDFLEVWSLNHVTENSMASWQVRKGNWVFDYAEQMVDGLPRADLQAAVDRFYAHTRARGVPMASLILGEGRGTEDFPADAWQLPGGGPKVPWQADSIVCDLPWKELRVTYDGDVFACCWGPRPIGNLRTETLESIWTSVAMQEMRTDLIDGVVPFLCSSAACHQIGGKARPAFTWRPTRDAGPSMELSAIPVSFDAESGLHELEQYEGRSLRWTDGSAKILVVPSVSGSAALEVKLWSFGDAAVAIYVDDAQLFMGHVPPEGIDAVFAIEVEDPEKPLTVRVDSTVMLETGDPRSLGVAIESLRLVQRTHQGASAAALTS